MDASPVWLFWIALVAAVAPIIAGLVPRRLVAEVVILLGLGMLIGPFGLDLAPTDGATNMFHDFGLAMLFLLAGYEIELKELTGVAGRQALLTWVVCLLLAFGLIALLGVTDIFDGEIAVAIALTSTSLGTLLPILKDGGLLGGAIGDHVLRHGAYGEIGPIVAMAVLLGVRGPLESLLVLAAFAGVAVLLALPSLHLKRETSRVLALIRAGAETTGQIPVRLTMLLLATLVAVASEFKLDIVLAAFAAGFILRLSLPDGDEHLEARVEGIAFGLLVPIFFVTSGMAIDPDAIADEPLAFVAVLVLILLVRGGPVLLATRLLGDRPRLGMRDSLTVASYASTGLPIIVAVTAVSVHAGQMSNESASILVAAGAATVLICPLLASTLLGQLQPMHTATSRTPPEEASP